MKKEERSFSEVSRLKRIQTGENKAQDDRVSQNKRFQITIKLKSGGGNSYDTCEIETSRKIINTNQEDCLNLCEFSPLSVSHNFQFVS